MQEITATQAPTLLIDVMKAGLVPMITSSPGLGKSSIARQIARELDLKVIDLRLSQCDPSDLLGFPSINAAKTKAGYVPMDTFPIAGDELPIKKDKDGADRFNMVPNPDYDHTAPAGPNAEKEIKEFIRYKGWLLFLDEMNSAAKSVQAAAYKIVLDKQVGIFELHPNVLMMAAGNLATDNAVVNKLGTAMQSRMIHFQLREDHKAFMSWAASTGIDYRVTSFLHFKPNALFAFDANHNDCTFPCPRTWEFVSKIIKPWKDSIHHSKAPILTGTVGEGTGREFLAFCEVFQDLPTIESIIANPTTVHLSDEPTVRYALTGMISTHVNQKNGKALMEFVNRLPVEFQIITLQAALLRDPGLMAEGSDFQIWVMENAAALM